MQRLRTVTSLDVSAVAGHHAMPAALLLDGDVPRTTSYGVYISQLIRFARVSSHLADFNACNRSLTAKLLQQGYRYHKLRKAFSNKSYRRHFELVSKYNFGLRSLLQQGLSEPEFYGDLVYKFRKTVGKTEFLDQFKKIIMRYKHIGYNVDAMRQGARFRLCDSLNIKLNIWVVADGHLSVSWPIEVQLVVFFCSSVSVVLLTPMGSPVVSTRCNCRVLGPGLQSLLKLR